MYDFDNMCDQTVAALCAFSEEKRDAAMERRAEANRRRAAGVISAYAHADIIASTGIAIDGHETVLAAAKNILYERALRRANWDPVLAALLGTDQVY